MKVVTVTAETAVNMLVHL